MYDVQDNDVRIAISVVIPVYNGAITIRPLVDTLVAGLAPYNLHVVLVSDGSKDNSHQACEEIFRKYPKVMTYLRLARHFGEHNAVMADLSHATGDHAVIMDDDFQKPPEDVARLVREARRGDFDIVYSYLQFGHEYTPFWVHYPEVTTLCPFTLTTIAKDLLRSMKVRFNR